MSTFQWVEAPATLQVAAGQGEASSHGLVFHGITDLAGYTRGISETDNFHTPVPFNSWYGQARFIYEHIIDQPLLVTDALYAFAKFRLNSSNLILPTFATTNIYILDMITGATGNEYDFIKNGLNTPEITYYHCVSMILTNYVRGVNEWQAGINEERRFNFFLVPQYRAVTGQQIKLENTLQSNNVTLFPFPVPKDTWINVGLAIRPTGIPDNIGFCNQFPGLTFAAYAPINLTDTFEYAYVKCCTEIVPSGGPAPGSVAFIPNAVAFDGHFTGKVPTDDAGPDYENAEILIDFDYLYANKNTGFLGA